VKQYTKINGCLILALIFISFNSNQIKSYPIGKDINTLYISRSDSKESNFSNKIIAQNEPDYLISGITAEVSKPTTVCTSNNLNFIIWRERREDGSFFKISKYYSNLSRINDPYVVLNANSLTSDDYSLSDPKLLIDSSNNLHIFWQLLGFDDPQQEDVYYLQMNDKLEIIVQPKIIHTYTLSGYTNSYTDTLIRTYFLDDTDKIHLLFADNYYYLLNNNGDINATTLIPGELGSAKILLLDSEGDALVVCENDDIDEINSIKYAIEETSIIELNRNLLFNTSEKSVHYMNILTIENNSYFYWCGRDMISSLLYNESYQFNLDGSLGDFGLLNEHFFNGYSLCLNSTHAVSLSYEPELFSNAEIYYSLFNPIQNHSYIETKLLVRFLKNENYIYSPHVFGTRIILNEESQFILSWYVNDGQNGFQVFLWKCNFDGTTPIPFVIVAPEQSHETNYTLVITFPRLSLLILIFIITKVTPKLLNRKKRKNKLK